MGGKAEAPPAPEPIRRPPPLEPEEAARVLEELEADKLVRRRRIYGYTVPGRDVL